MFENLSNFAASGWIPELIMWIAIASTIITIGVILSENRNPVRSLAWVTVLLLLPVFGLILYIFFGRNIKNTRMISRNARRRIHRRWKIHAEPKDYALSPESLQQINLGRSLTGEPFCPANSVEVFTDGRSKFESLCEDLKAACQSINIQYYIIADDNCGRRLADILIERARAGVSVRLIYDHVGSLSTSSKYFRRLTDAGVEVIPFFKVSFPLLGTRINWRNHRKIAVIDERVAYIGGMNIADRYIDGGKKFGVWRDTHLRIIGPAVSAIQYSFAVDWNFAGGGLIEDTPGTDAAHFKPHFRQAVSSVCAQLLTSGPTGQWSNIAMAFHKAIANARRRVYIQTPYFLPTEALLKALQSAALAHVDVRIMIPQRSDSAMLTHASNSYIAECLRAGIKIYLYKPGMMHAKMIIVDDELVSIGSTNFDFRSFDYNFEANLFMFSKELNDRMTDVFRNDQKDCERVIAAEWRRRPRFQKACESVVRLFSPIL